MNEGQRQYVETWAAEVKEETGGFQDPLFVARDMQMAIVHYNGTTGRYSVGAKLTDTSSFVLTNAHTNKRYIVMVAELPE